MGVRGALVGGPDVACRFKKWQCSTSLSQIYIFSCLILISRNGQFIIFVDLLSLLIRSISPYCLYEIAVSPGGF